MTPVTRVCLRAYCTCPLRAGGTSTRLIDALAPHEELVEFDCADYDAFLAACDGVHTVVHLAADPSPSADFYGSLLQRNIVGKSLRTPVACVGVRRDDLLCWCLRRPCPCRVQMFAWYQLHTTLSRLHRQRVVLELSMPARLTQCVATLTAHLRGWSWAKKLLGFARSTASTQDRIQAFIGTIQSCRQICMVRQSVGARQLGGYTASARGCEFSTHDRY